MPVEAQQKVIRYMVVAFIALSLSLSLKYGLPFSSSKEDQSDVDRSVPIADVLPEGSVAGAADGGALFPEPTQPDHTHLGWLGVVEVDEAVAFMNGDDVRLYVAGDSYVTIAAPEHVTGMFVSDDVLYATGVSPATVSIVVSDGSLQPLTTTDVTWASPGYRVVDVLRYRSMTYALACEIENAVLYSACEIRAVDGTKGASRIVVDGIEPGLYADIRFSALDAIKGTLTVLAVEGDGGFASAMVATYQISDGDVVSKEAATWEAGCDEMGACTSVRIAQNHVFDSIMTSQGTSREDLRTCSTMDLTASLGGQGTPLGCVRF